MKFHALILTWLLVAPLTASAQVTVFSDNLISGSTVNSLSPTPPTASSTSYEVIASKAWNPNPPTLTGGELKFGIVATTGGGVDLQALFTTAPVELLTTGSYIELAITFTVIAGVLTSDTQLGVGLFNAGGIAPWGGGLANAANNINSNAVTGGAQNWQGYLAQIGYPGGTSGNSQFVIRPAQANGDNRNQVTTVNGSTIYGFQNSTTVGSSSSGPNVSLTVGGRYTEVLNITRMANGSLQLTATIYTNDTSGTLLTSVTATTSTTPVTTTFDALAIGWRTKASLASAIAVGSVQVVKFVQSTCVSAQFANTASMVLGQTNGYVSITLPANATASGPLSVDLVSTNPTVAYPDNAAGGRRTVTFAQNSPYSSTNIPVTVAALGVTQCYLTNATPPACVVAPSSSGVITVISNVPPPAQQPAFPGAEGEGMFVAGGRGGDVYHVTNLNDSGAGSFRYGLDNTPSGGRTIVFDVGGMITLASTLRFSNTKITVAGQTAPGMGICLRNYGVTVSAGNVIIRHIRCRAGDAVKGPGFFTGDSLSISASQVMVDHCSASWGIDEGMSSNAAGSQDVTVQYCFITENLDQTGLWHDAWDANYNPGGPSHHSMGSLIKPVSGDGQVSYHHNFWACNYSRNPAVGTYDVPQVFKADIRNNVIYNNNQNGYRSTGLCNRIDLNYVGNYIITGPETQSSWSARAFDAKAEDANFYLYQSGNMMDSNLNLVRDGTDTGLAMFAGTYNLLASAASMRSVTTHTAEAAYNLVTSGAGAFSWNRDSVDARHVQQLLSMTGAVIDSQTEVGGYPTIPTASRPAGWDTDNDGLPNFWETANGLNPNAANNNHTNTDGYTDLEQYMNWLAEPNAVGAGNSFVDVNLRTFTSAMASNATYSVSNPTNGTVTLLGDGRTARFTPATNFFGRASFRFVATDSLAGGAITNTVGVLITPPPPRFLNVNWIAGKLVMSGIGLPTNSSFYLLTSTNAALPAANWTRVATNQFDAAGNFIITNTPNPNMPHTFYRLQLP